jgi:predicted secreted hydrolase
MKSQISKSLCAFALLALFFALPMCCGSSISSLIPPGGWQESNDALHPYNTENYYEWWYLDTQFENGYTCCLTFYWRTHIGQDHIPYVQIAIYKPDGTLVRGGEPRELSECKASQEKCDVVLGNDFLRQEGNDYRISLHTKELGADLTLHRMTPPWKWSEGGLIVDDPTGMHGWIIAVPRGNVEGKLWIGKEVINVTGQGYHDHNWGNVDMSASKDGWGWGHTYDEKLTYVYFWLMPKGGGIPTPKLYIAMDDQVILASDNLNFTLSDYVVDPTLSDSIPTLMVIEGKEGDVEVSCQISAVKMLLASAANFPFPMHYYRRLNNFTGTNIFSGTTYSVSSNDVINEYVIFARS